jgi:ribosomal protein S12 methylthiotransferase accessory factor
VSGIRDVVSPYVGLVRSVEERLVGVADSRLPVYTSELASDDRVLGGPVSHVGVTSGMAPDRDDAIDAALGEAVERYSLSYLPSERIVRATAAELGAAAVAPERFALFCAEQYAHPRFPFVPFTRDTQIPWIDGWAVDTGQSVWVPAELVFLADPVAPGEQRIGYATSSGAACAESESDAVLRGLLELCERDAFMIVWAARLALPLLEWSRDPALLDLDRRYFAPAGLRYSAVDLSAVHGIPSVLGVVRAPAGASAVLGVGAGTAATIERAWWKALAEAFGTRTSAANRVAAGEGEALRDDGANVLTIDDHILFHARANRAAAAAFLDSSSQCVDVRDVAPLPDGLDAQVRDLAGRIAVAGSTAYAVDVTAPDVATLGLRVVKTLAPELCALDVPHPARFLGSARLRTVPAELGLTDRPLSLSDLNPDPHPFP